MISKVKIKRLRKRNTSEWIKTHISWAGTNQIMFKNLTKTPTKTKNKWMTRIHLNKITKMRSSINITKVLWIKLMKSLTSRIYSQIPNARLT